MAIGDAYKPTPSKKPAPEPERYEGIPAPFETDHDLEALDYIRTAARHKREGLGG